MKNEESRLTELIACFVLFEIGSTTLFQIAADAGQDAWLAMLIGSAVGFMLLLLYLWIHKMNPNRSLYEMCVHFYGKWLGKGVGFILVFYFAYESSRNLRDLGELAAFALLNRTPLAVLMLIGILVVGNSVRYGAHIVFLVCLAMLPTVLLSYLLLIFMIIGKGMLHFEYMQPVLENGFGPVISAALPETVSFPFGQSLLFLVFFPMVRKDKNLGKAMLISYICTAVVLTVINQINILVLGPTLTKLTLFPLLQVVQLIEAAEVFERMDVLFVIVLFVGLGTKIIMFYIGAVTGLAQITKIGYRKWVLPIGALIFGASFLSPNFSHHLWVGIDVILNKLDPYFQFGLPLVLLTVMLLRRKKRMQE
ncbi:endospore germination permease [Paenibacillus sanfengchensis]|uniref:GerAB/ArcD/ProY family transporter n=1 Tax=Paenibacillus sanfengchensis TaxID=3119819 RepID=UPI002FE2158F